MKKKFLIIGIFVFAVAILALGMFWLFGNDRKLSRAEAFLSDGHIDAAVTLLEATETSDSVKVLYQTAVLYNRAQMAEKRETVILHMKEIAPQSAYTYAARLLESWSLDNKKTDAIYAEAAQNEVDLSFLVPRVPGMKVENGAVVAPFSEVEIYPYRKEETVYLELNGETASPQSPCYSAPILAVYGEYEICAVAVNEDGVPSPALFRTISVTEEKEVPFVDATFKALILQELGETEYRAVSNRELRGLDNLVLYAEDGTSLTTDEIRSFEDLRYLAHVTSLGISQAGEIRDLSALSYMYSLKHFALYGPVEDNFETIASLRGLETLSFERSSVDLSVVEDMSALTALSVTVGDYTELSTLSHLKELKTLSLEYHQIQDISALSELTALESISLYDNEITDLSPLEALPNLKYLDVRKNPVETAGNLSPETLLMGE